MRAGGTARGLLAIWLLSCGAPGDRVGQPPDQPPDTPPAEPPEACADADRDGFGPGCSLGEDCDDDDATIHEGCLTCGAAAREGCACEDDAPAECHSPAPELDAHGRLRCFAGTRSCTDGVWGACEYDEAWDVSSPARSVGGAPGSCGNCDPQCYEVGGAVDAGDVTVDNAVNTLYDCVPDGAGGENCGVVIDGRPTDGGAYSYIAMPEDGSGTVGKIRNTDGAEVARYYVGRVANAANDPSRTTIDAVGNAYVGNRAFGLQGSATKIAGSLVYCVDRNGNGSIETSTNSTPLPIGTDECLIWTVDLGADSDAKPRGLAIDRGDPEDAPEGYLWVATWDDGDNPANVGGGRLYQIHPRDGAILQSIQLPQHAYGAVADNRNPQRIWTVNQRNGLFTAVRVDNGAVEGPFWPDEPGRCTTRRGVTTCDLGGYGGYGMAFDGRHLWEAARGSSYAHGYDIVDNVWCRVPTSGACDKGVAVRLQDDGARRVYCGGDSGGQSAVEHWDSDFAACVPADVYGRWCTRWDGENCGASVVETREVRTRPAAAVRMLGAAYTGGLGVGVDFENRVWVVNRGSDDVAVYDPADETVVTYPTTAARLPGPYTYSDFTGYQRAVFTNMSGTFSVDYGTTAPGCPAGQIILWGDLRWTAVMPPNTRIRFTVRTAGAAGDLTLASPMVAGEAPTNPAPIYIDDALTGAGAFNHHRYLRVTATLISDDGLATPILQSMNVDWVCLDAE